MGERDQECSAATWVGVRNQAGSGPKGNNYVMGSTFQKLNGVYTGNNSGARDSKTCIYGFSSKHPRGPAIAGGDAKVASISERLGQPDSYCD